MSQKKNDDMYNRFIEKLYNNIFELQVVEDLSDINASVREDIRTSE